MVATRSQWPDTSADYKPFSWRDIHEPYQCCLYNHQNRGNNFIVARHFECHSGRRYVMIVPNLQQRLYGGTSIGPAHAVYFATYEAVKQAMGGNNGTEHHPLAAGNLR